MKRDTHMFRGEQLVSGYEDRMVVQDVTISIPPRKISVIIGANACGKSTLLKTISRLIRPSSGKIMLDGQEIGTFLQKSWHKYWGCFPSLPSYLKESLLLTW